MHGLLTFECMWDRAGIIYLFESWACWSFEGGRECLSLVQSVSDHFKQCVGRDLNLRVAWNNIGRSYRSYSCSLLFFGGSNSETSCPRWHMVLTSSDYLLFISGYSKSPNSLRGHSDYNLLKPFHYCKNTDSHSNLPLWAYGVCYFLTIKLSGNRDKVLAAVLKGDGLSFLL